MFSHEINRFGGNATTQGGNTTIHGGDATTQSGNLATKFWNYPYKIQNLAAKFFWGLNKKSSKLNAKFSFTPVGSPILKISWENIEKCKSLRLSSEEFFFSQIANGDMGNFAHFFRYYFYGLSFHISIGTEL